MHNQKSEKMSLTDEEVSACFRFQHLDVNLPQRQTVRITDGELEQYSFPAYNCQRGATWLPVPMDEGLKADMEDNLQKRNHLRFQAEDWTC